MKKVLFLLLSAVGLNGCPTCVGRAETDSSLFFTQEFYKKNIAGKYRRPDSLDKKGLHPEKKGEES